MVDSTMKHAGDKKLPPPPAPTSSDANPWAMSATQPRRIPGLRIDPAKLPDRLKTAPPKPADATPGAGQKPSKTSVLPFVVLGCVFMAAGLNALESFRGGDYVGAFLPFIVVGVFVIGAVSRLMRQKR